jgi:hypothetical protein
VLSRCDFGASITDHLCVQVDSAHCLCVARCSNVFQAPQTRISLQFRYPQPRRPNHGVSRPLPLPHRARTVGPHAASEIVCAASQASPAASETGARTAPTCMVKGPPQEAVRAQAALGAVGGGPSVPPPYCCPYLCPYCTLPPPFCCPYLCPYCTTRGGRDIIFSLRCAVPPVVKQLRGCAVRCGGGRRRGRRPGPRPARPPHDSANGLRTKIRAQVPPRTRSARSRRLVGRRAPGRECKVTDPPLPYASPYRTAHSGAVQRAVAGGRQPLESEAIPSTARM